MIYIELNSVINKYILNVSDFLKNISYKSWTMHFLLQKYLIVIINTNNQYGYTILKKLKYYLMVGVII